MKVVSLPRVAAFCLLAAFLGCGGAETENPQGAIDRREPNERSTPNSSESRVAEPAEKPGNLDVAPPVKLAGTWRRHSEATGMSSEPLRAVWMNADQTEGWATGDGGVMLHFADGKWNVDEAASRLTPERLSELAMSTDGAEGWAAGGGTDAVFIHYQNGAWKPYQARQAGYLPRIAAIAVSADAKSGWAIDQVGRLLKLAAGAWTLIDAEFPEKKLNAVKINAAGTEGWAAGDKGIIQQLANGKWTVDDEASSLTDQSITELSISEDGTSGWAVVTDYNTKTGMLRLEKGKWTADPPGGFASDDSEKIVTCIAVSNDASVGWAGTNTGGFLRYREGKWESAVPAGELTKGGLESIVLSPDGARGCAVDWKGNIFRLRDGAWVKEDLPQPVTRSDLNAIWMNEAGTEGWAAGNRVLLHYSEGTWNVVDVAGDLSDIWLNAAGTQGWAVGRGKQILRFEGGQWKPVEGPKTGVNDIFLEALWVKEDGSEGWIAADNGFIFHLSQGAWQTDAQGSEVIERIPWDIWMSSDGTAGWIVGDEMILRYANGKWSFDEPASELVSQTHGIAMRSDGSEGWAVGDPGIVHFKDGKWREYEESIGAELLRAVSMNADFTSGFAVGERGEIVRYANGKWQLSPERKGVSATLNDLWLKADGSEGWAVGERGEIWRFTLDTE